MRWIPLALAASLVCGGTALAQEPAAAQPKTIDELLDLVREGRAEQSREMQRREREFREARDQQKQRLAEARSQLAAEERRSEELEKTFEENEGKLAELEATLAERLGTLGELFGIVRQVAGDARGTFEASVTTAQFPARLVFLQKMARSKELPRPEELERLWYLLLQEMHETGKVVRFPAEVVEADGERVQAEPIRVGAFNAVLDGRYLVFSEETAQLVELPRQPASRYRSMARELAGADSGPVAMGIDPSRGQILSLLVETPDLRERLSQGGLVAYITLALGGIGLLIAAERLFVLTRMRSRVKQQVGEERADDRNPLGRILAVWQQNRNVDVEALERKLDEAILKDTPRIERGISTIKVLSVVAPLLGLLGTVTGMIETFQSITLFGTGDPKLMAGGISQALVTTVVGLIVAIPLVLLHSFVSGRSKEIVEILEEQSAGLVAQRAEVEFANRGTA